MVVRPQERMETCTRKASTTEASISLFFLHMCMLGHFSHVRLFAVLWTIALYAPLSMGFSRQEYWSGLPCPPPGDLPNPGIELASLVSPALSDGFFTTSTTREAPFSLDTLPSLLHFILLARVLPCFSVSRL